MHKTVFVLPNIDKCSVEAGHYFAHLPHKYITHLYRVPWLVFMQFHQLLVLYQGKLYLFR